MIEYKTRTPLCGISVCFTVVGVKAQGYARRCAASVMRSLRLLLICVKGAYVRSQT